MMTDMYYRIFIFSREQAEQKKSIDNKMGKLSKLGTVVVNGVAKSYTDIVANMSQVKYSDSIKVAEGDIRKIKYTSPN